MTLRKKRLIGNIVSALLAAAFVCTAMGVSVHAAVDGFVANQVYYDGVTVNGYAIGGMTYDEALAALRPVEQALLNERIVSLHYEGDASDLTSDDLGLSTDLETLLRQIQQVMPAEGTYEEKYNTALMLNTNAAYQLSVSVDKSAIDASISEYVIDLNVAPVNASAAFDPITETFAYTPAEAGVYIDEKALSEQVYRAVSEQTEREIRVKGAPVEADISDEDIRANTVLVSEYVTLATQNENRNRNIELMCRAVNGAAIQPGEVFSINGIVGERTAEKGFMEAPAIIQGELEDEVGGGICQLSGTLYNAALLADMKIEERHHHTWPSDYLPVGLDATLNWDDKDLKLKNVSSYPMYISARITDDNEVVVRLFGQPLSGNTVIEVVNDIVTETEAPSPDVIYTDKVAPGEKKVVKASRNGYHVIVYRNYYEDGVYLKSEMISDDTFFPVKGVVWQGKSETDVIK